MKSQTQMLRDVLKWLSENNAISEQEKRAIEYHLGQHACRFAEALIRNAICSAEKTLGAKFTMEAEDQREMLDNFVGPIVDAA